MKKIIIINGNSVHNWYFVNVYSSLLPIKIWATGEKWLA